MELCLLTILDEMKPCRAGMMCVQSDHVTCGLLPTMDAYRKGFIMPTYSSLMGVMKSNETQRFIFDAAEYETLDDVAEAQATAEEMMASDRFHLPYPTVWVEDGSSDEEKRRCYLYREQGDLITAWQVSYDRQGLLTAQASNPSQISRHRIKVSIVGQMTWHRELKEFCYVTSHRIEGLLTRCRDQNTFGMTSGGVDATVMLSRFLAALAASNTAHDPGETRRRVVRSGRDPMSKREKDFKTVVYPFTHVHPPFDDDAPMEGGRRPYKRHFVRGYTWGKNTRPREEQRWIAPFWRGRGEVAVRRDHYEVKAS